MKKKFIILSLTFLFISMLASCGNPHSVVITAEGDIVTNDLETKGKSSFEFKNFCGENGEGSFVKVYFVEDNDDRINVKCHQNIYDKISFSYIGDKLVIDGGYKNAYANADIVFSVYTKDINSISLANCNTFVNGDVLADEAKLNLTNTSKINFTSLDIKKLDLHCSGVSSFTSGLIEADELDVELSGASRFFSLALTVGEFDVKASGASSLNVAGLVNELELELSGASILTSSILSYVSAQKADVELSGASIANINVSESLKYDLSGASKLRYSGEPIIKGKATGESTVEKR